MLDFFRCSLCTNVIDRSQPLNASSYLLLPLKSAEMMNNKMNKLYQFTGYFPFVFAKITTDN